MVKLHRVSAQIQPQVIIEDHIRQPQFGIAVNAFVAVHGLEQKLFFGVEVAHPLGGLAVSHNLRRGRKGIVSEGVVAVVVGVDQIEDGLGGHPPHRLLNFPGHRAVDVGVNH